MAAKRETQTPPEELIDGDMTLRRWHQSDADALYAAVSSSLSELSPWMPWAANGYTKASTEGFLLHAKNVWDAGKEFNFAIIHDGRVVGSSGLMTNTGGFEIGYWLATEATGRGLATRATALLTRMAFDLGADYVQIQHKEANDQSGAVPRRLGFKYLGLRPPLRQESGSESQFEVLWRLDRDSDIAQQMLQQQR